MKQKSLGRGIVILSISSIILKLLSSIYMPILSLILKDEGMAIYNIGYNYFVFLFAITSLGFQPVITKLVVEEKTKKSGRVFEVLNESKRFLMILGAIVSILFIILSKSLSVIANSKDVINVIMFLAPAIFFAAVLTSYRGFFQGDNNIDDLVISNIIEQVFNVAISLIFASLLIKVSISFGSAGGTIGTTIGAIGAIMFLRYSLNRRYPEYK
ncbi:oligosaccharide flippase family protein, partial [uncultured Clostridium sp.]|uniref:oligosaccharide flippase family protein n=1 Tax=uncultured Clostridium sp. TaxID=59620 RepID=UPI0025E30C39